MTGSLPPPAGGRGWFRRIAGSWRATTMAAMGAMAGAGRWRLWLPFLSAGPWRSVWYLAVRLPLPVAGFGAIVIPAATGTAIGAAIAGGALMVYLVVAVATSGIERRAVRMLDLPELIDPHPQDEPGGWEAPGGGVVVVGRGWWTRLDRRLREPATAKELAHAVVSLLLGPLDLVILFLLPTTVVVLLLSPLVIAAGEGPVGAVVWTVETRAEAWLALAVGLVAVPPCCHTVTLAARAHAVLARALLAPRGAELAARVRELTRSRLRLVDAFDVERRRIERDLHDGAQQHLVAMVMTLDLARIELEALEGTAHAAAADLVAQAHAQARRMMVELRELIRAIHPQLLVERGLGPALEELADRSPVAARCVVDVPQRPPPPVETTAYFVVAEALANTAKHSGAERAEIGVWTTGDRLVVQVRDDGCGGADADQGTGLRGLGDRVSALDGELTLWSPVGGPTVVRASLPLVIQPAGGAV